MIVLIVVVLIPVAEPLVPRIPFVVLRAGPVPAGGIGTTSRIDGDLLVRADEFRPPGLAGLIGLVLVSSRPLLSTRIPSPSEMNMLAGTGLDL